MHPFETERVLETKLIHAKSSQHMWGSWEVLVGSAVPSQQVQESM